MNRIESLRVERFVVLSQVHPDALLDLFKIGEPVSLTFVKRIASQNPRFLDKLLNIEFKLMNEPYHSSKTHDSDSQAIFAIMKNRYGKNLAEALVINHDNLWHNFLPYAAKSLFEDSRLYFKFHELIESENYQKAFALLENLPKKYSNQLQRKLKKDDAISFVDFAEEYNFNASQVINAEDMINNDILSASIVRLYLEANRFKDSAIKKVYRRNGGAEILRSIESNSVKCFLEKAAN